MFLVKEIEAREYMPWFKQWISVRLLVVTDIFCTGLILLPEY